MLIHVKGPAEAQDAARVQSERAVAPGGLGKDSHLVSIRAHCEEAADTGPALKPPRRIEENGLADECAQLPNGGGFDAAGDRAVDYIDGRCVVIWALRRDHAVLRKRRRVEGRDRKGETVIIRRGNAHAVEGVVAHDRLHVPRHSDWHVCGPFDGITVLERRSAPAHSRAQVRKPGLVCCSDAKQRTWAIAVTPVSFPCGMAARRRWICTVATLRNLDARDEASRVLGHEG
mmetsp:Transcript_11223/g.33212  ORF Transcript_11223/g.33212 Transcript_11223/m.33212 type:complete len:231 (-) Transcript_11223:236-928(-)